jgi:hypothetical protein
MFPSGRWRGYWQQKGWGRQAMHNLVLRFEDGLVAGEGIDVVGRFTFAGACGPGGTVVLVKHYPGRHRVVYRGAYNGEGAIVGEWTIGDHLRGPFALSPEDVEAPADAPILTITATPPGKGSP